MAGGHAWQGVCVAGGHVWWGACVVGGMCGRGCMHGRGVHGMHAPASRYYEIRSMSGR